MKRASAPSIGMTTPRSRVAELASNIQIRNGLLVAGAVLAYFALGIPLIALLRPRAAHMASHILLMNALAPVLANAIIANFARPAVFASIGVLIAATVLQLALLWTWHAPNLWGLALREPLLHLLMQASLLAASLTFWLAILSEKGVVRWRGIVALLLTGKFSCLLGVLLLFAPRLLYADGHADPGYMVADGDEQLEDQRLAGLLMLIACPFCYVLAGIAIAAKWLQELEIVGAGQALTSLDDVSPLPR